jgi:hypothetical protein
MTDSPSKLAYLVAVVCSGAALALIMVGLLRWELPRLQGFILPLAGSWLLGGVFGFLYPGSTWRWGLCVSTAFWAYFGLVFVALLFTSERDWLLPFVAATTFVCGWLGAMTGNRLARAAGRRSPAYERR